VHQPVLMLDNFTESNLTYGNKISVLVVYTIRFVTVHASDTGTDRCTILHDNEKHTKCVALNIDKHTVSKSSCGTPVIF